MKTVRDILRYKGSAIFTVAPESWIYEALRLMDEKNIGAVLVLEDDNLCGIFSERDYARKVVLKGKTSRATRVRDAMTSRVACVRLDNSIEECMAVMTDRRIRHLPVLDEANRLVGVISIGDVVQAKISEQQFLIEQLESYISGSR